MNTEPNGAANLFWNYKTTFPSLVFGMVWMLEILLSAWTLLFLFFSFDYCRYCWGELTENVLHHENTYPGWFLTAWINPIVAIFVLQPFLVDSNKVPIEYKMDDID